MAKMTRAKRWYLAHARGQGLAVGQTVVHDLHANVDPATTDATVVRVRGKVRVFANAVEAGEGGLVFMGMMVITNEALSVGASAVPDPASETVSADWLWHDVAIPGDSATDSAADEVVVINNKSSRKMVNANKNLVLVVTNASGVQTYNYTYAIRSLLLL